MLERLAGEVRVPGMLAYLEVFLRARLGLVNGMHVPGFHLGAPRWLRASSAAAKIMTATSPASSRVGAPSRPASAGLVRVSWGDVVVSVGGVVVVVVSAGGMVVVVVVVVSSCTTVVWRVSE